MKILLLTDHYSPNGGAENYFFALQKRLQATSNVKVFSIGFAKNAEKTRDCLVLKEHCSNLSKLIWRLLPHPLVYLKLRHAIQDFRPDVIHLHNLKQHTAAILKAVKKQRVVQSVHDYSLICPTAQNIHTDLQVCPTGLRLRCFWKHRVKFSKLTYLIVAFAHLLTKKKLRQFVSAFFVPSPMMIQFLKVNGFNHVRLQPLFHTPPSGYSFDKVQQTHFLFAGQLEKHKGVFILLDEFALAVKNNPQVVLHLAGTGLEEENLRARAHTLGIHDHIIFHGWKNDLSDLYQQCIALIFPSIGMESFGLVMSEAMSHARPIIGANRSSVTWLVDHQNNGLLFDPLQKGSLADCVLKIASDVSLAQTLGVNAYKKIQALVDNEKAFATLLQAYQEVTKGAQAPPASLN